MIFAFSISFALVLKLILPIHKSGILSHATRLTCFPACNAQGTRPIDPDPWIPLNFTVHVF